MCVKQIKWGATNLWDLSLRHASPANILWDTLPPSGHKGNCQDLEAQSQQCLGVLGSPTAWQAAKSSLVQFSPQSSLTLCDPMDCSTPGLPTHHQLLEFTQTDVHRVGDAIQPSHPLSSPSPPAPNPSHYQGLFQWVSSSHEVAKVLEF